jgi:ureidoglycolate lyase
MTTSFRQSAETQPIEAEPITEEAFRPYGQVIQVGSRAVVVNAGTAQRHDIGDVLIRDWTDGRLLLSVFEAEGQRLPLRIQMLERHPRSAQTIVPMNANGHVVVVALGASDGVDESTLRAFLLGSDQGVNYNPGVWHHPIIALDHRSLFFVQSWQDGSELDCEETTICPRLLTADRI